MPMTEMVVAVTGVIVPMTGGSVGTAGPLASGFAVHRPSLVFMRYISIYLYTRCVAFQVRGEGRAIAAYDCRARGRVCSRLPIHGSSATVDKESNPLKEGSCGP